MTLMIARASPGYCLIRSTRGREQLRAASSFFLNQFVPKKPALPFCKTTVLLAGGMRLRSRNPRMMLSTKVEYFQGHLRVTIVQNMMTRGRGIFCDSFTGQIPRLLISSSLRRRTSEFYHSIRLQTYTPGLDDDGEVESGRAWRGGGIFERSTGR